MLNKLNVSIKQIVLSKKNLYACLLFSEFDRFLIFDSHKSQKTRVFAQANSQLCLVLNLVGMYRSETVELSINGQSRTWGQPIAYILSSVTVG